MSDSQDGTPADPPPDGAALTSQIHTINISCGGCNEAYSVSDDDGLAGMSFPCDNCGTMVEVPEMPWEDQGGTTFETTNVPMEMSFDDIPEEKSFDGGTAINVTCFSCLEEYNVSADDGLAGMDFPCDNCGAEIKVPDHPWPDDEPVEAEDDDFFNVGTPLTEEEQAEREKQAHNQMSAEDLDALPEESDEPSIEGGTEITVMCFSCLEEYNVSAEDGLAGIEFPCSNCGADVQVPDHPWPDDEPAEDYDDDFFNVGTPLTEEEQAARDLAEEEEEQAAKAKDDLPPAPAAKPKEKPARQEAAPSQDEAEAPQPQQKKKKAEKKEKKEKKDKKDKKEKKKPAEAKPEQFDEPAPAAQAPRQEAPREAPREAPPQPRRPMAAGPAGQARRPQAAAGGGSAAPRRPSVVSGGSRRIQARTKDPDTEVTVVHEQGAPAPRPVDPGSAARTPMPEAARPTERKTFREPDRPRLDMGSGGISAPSGNYAGGGGGGSTPDPEEVTVRLQRGGRQTNDPDEQPTEAFQRAPQRGSPRRPPPQAGKSKGPIVVRVVSPFFAGMKKLFSRGGEAPETPAAPIEQASPGPGQHPAGPSGAQVSPQEQARRRQVQIIHEQREDIRRGVGVRETVGDDDLPEGENDAQATDLDQEARQLKIRNIKLAVLAALVVAPFFIWSDVFFGPLLGDKARPETDKKFWEDREIGQEEEDSQPTVDLSEMLGAKEESEVDTAKPISADNVDSLGYRNLRNQVDLLAAGGPGTNKSLLLWARFRLAYAYKDPVARKQLIATAPKRLNSEEYGPMGLAAAAGALALQGKGNKARKLTSKLSVSEGKESPQMYLVMALSQKPRANSEKTIAMLDEALSKSPNMIDAQLLRAQLMAKRTKNGEGWAPELVDRIVESKDPDNAVRGGELFIQQKLYAEQARMFEPFKNVPASDAMSPERRGLFINMLTGSHLHKADFSEAYATAKTRLDVAASSATIVDVASLAEAAGMDPLAILSKNSGMLGGGGDKGRVYLETVRWMIKRDNLAGAKATFDKIKSRPGVRGTPWMHMMDAEIASAKGKTGQAKKALKKATKGRSKNPYAMYAKETLAQSKPGLGRLEQLSKKMKTPRLQLDLAIAQSENEKLGEAEAGFETLLWSQAGAPDPVAAVLGWIDLLDRKGESDKARTLAESVQASRPDDLRAVNQLINLADRNDDEDAAAKWATARIRLKKKDRKAKEAGSAKPAGSDQGTATGQTPPNQGGSGSGDKAPVPPGNTGGTP